MDTIVTNTPIAPITLPASGCNCSACQQTALERVSYFPRQLLTVDDMVAEQNYFREKLRRHSRYLHGTGVVWGLIVTASPTDTAPWQVAISEGYALGPYGDDIFVACTVYLDLARCAAGDVTDPCDPTAYNRLATGAPRDAFIAIKYSECLARPVRSIAAGCGCGDAGCEYSRIRDSFEVGCIPRPVSTLPPSLCDVVNKKAALSCPPAPATPWVLLADAILPSSTKTAITDKEIVNTVRQYVFSTSMIQQQVIQCCRQSSVVSVPLPVQVANVTPANQAVVNASPAAITIVLNKPVQAASVNAQSILVAQEKGEAVEASSVTYDAASNTVTFTPKAPLQSGAYSVTVKGAGPTPVIDSDKLALDGSGDGKAGSDHVTSFTYSQKLP